MNKAQGFTLVGSIVLLFGAFLPWISVVDLYGSDAVGHKGIEIGWEGDGFLTGGIGLALLLIIILTKGTPGRRPFWIGAILALLASLVVFSDFLRIVEIGPEAGFFAATGVGLIVTLIGALLALIGGAQGISQRADPMAGKAGPAGVHLSG